MKKGLRISVLNFKEVVKYLEKYDFLHFGSETCENLIFYYKKLLKKLIILDKELVISFPPISENLFSYSRDLLLSLKDVCKKKNISFSLNDFGMIEFVRDVFPSSEIFIGRHLSKAFFSLTKKKLTINSLNSIRFFRKNYKISKYEISSFDEKPDTNLHLLFDKKIDISFFVHYPYVLLSTARNCVIGFNDLSPSCTAKGIMCDKICLKGGYKIDVGNIGQELYLFENSVYRKLKINVFETKLSDFNVSGVIFNSF